MASSIHGAARSTLDVDVAAELDEEAALSLIAALQGDFYVNREAALDAVRRRSCFNFCVPFSHGVSFHRQPLHVVVQSPRSDRFVEIALRRRGFVFDPSPSYRLGD